VSSTVGIAGTGRMGTAIGLRLMSLGNQIVVWNRTPVKTVDLAEKGASVTASPSELASKSDVVITMLTDAGAIEEVFLGQEGLLAGPVEDRLFIEMSTVEPGTIVSIAARARAAGAALIDCPVAGSVRPAMNGNLIGYVGGEDSDVARARPVLDLLCRRVEHVGEIGSGSRLKLAVQLPMHLYWQTLGEALALCRPLDLDPARLVDIIIDTPGAPKALAERRDAIIAVLRGEDHTGTAFDIDSVRKDLGIMIAEAGSLGLDTPMAELALESFDDVAALGLGDRPAATLTRLLMQGGDSTGNG
jgi:3-hydroxyisobutyrate dehydrogenase